MSFIDSTLVLGMSEGRITSIQDCDFIKTAHTIHVCLMSDNSFIQVTETSIIHIRKHIGKENNKWDTDNHKKIK